MWKHSHSILFRKVLCLVVCLCVLGSTSGCLRRRMTINSNPPGATVYVDGCQIGKTPVSTDFTYYGTRNIRLELDNYQTMNVKQRVAPPWYEFPGIDFFSETFTVGEVKDHHVYTYDLQQRAISSDEQIMDRARGFAYEGSRSVNPDGSLGTPITSENYHAPNHSTVGENPDASMNRGIPLSDAETHALAPPVEEPIQESSADAYIKPETQEVPTPYQTTPTLQVPQANPNTMPTGSADWDSPNRYPAQN